MQKDQTNVALLERDAADVRERVEASLKQTIERDVLRPVPTAGFSKVEHVVEAVLDPSQQERADEGLLSIGNVDGEEEKFRSFVARLTEVRDAVPAGARKN